MAKQSHDLLLAADSVELKGGKTPTALIVAYSGDIMNCHPNGDVVLDLAGMKFAETVILLASHNASIRSVVGHGKPSIRGGQLYVAAQLSTATDDGRLIVALHREGVAFQASVGCRILASHKIYAGETVVVNGRELTAGPGGLLICTSTHLREVSVCPLGADPNTSVTISAKHKVPTMAKKATRRPSRKPPVDEAIIEATTSGRRVSDASDSELPAGGVERDRELRAREAERVNTISRICAQYDHPTIEVDGERVDLEAHAIREGWETEGLELRAMRAARPHQGPAIHHGATGAPSATHIEAALLVRAGLERVAEQQLGARTLEQSRHLHRATVLDLCAAALRLDGVAVPTSRDEMLRASFTTLSMPAAFGNAMNKSLLAAYTESPATWRSFCATRPANDFKEHTSIRPSWLGEMDEVGSEGELKHGDMDEATIPWQIGTFGKMFRYSRQKMINDDLDVLSETGPALGRMALRKVSDLVYQRLFAAGTFFDASKKNLLAGGAGVSGVLAPDALGAAIAKMRTQRDVKNSDLDIQPVVLVVAPELEQKAKTALESEFIQRATNEATGNPLRKAVKLEVESRMSNTTKFASANKDHWYLFASPADVAMIVGFLEGKQAPTVEFFGLDHEVNTLAVAWRCYFDFGVALGDYRAAVKADGVAAS